MIPPIGAVSALGPGAGITPISGLGADSQLGGASATSATGGFGGALLHALDSVQQAQDTAATTTQGLATGAVTDPAQAITAMESAQLTMELASQVSAKATQDIQTIFSTPL